MTACGERGIGKLRVLIGLLLIVALVAAYFWATLTWSYAAGERADPVGRLGADDAEQRRVGDDGVATALADQPVRLDGIDDP